MQQANRHGDIHRRKTVRREICNFVTNKFTSLTIRASCTSDIIFVAIDSDVECRRRQIAQQGSCSASKIENPVALFCLNYFFCKPPEPTSRADQVMERLISQRERQERPDASTFAH